MNKIIKREIEFAGKKLVLETGELAISANMSVKATYGDTVLLATVCAGPANPEIDYFPLTLAYQERLYASGTIKSSRFIKRDGRPTDSAIIIRRLMDHAIRPLFPSDYMDTVQIIITVLSLDEESDPEFLAMIAASAALHASDVPWNGPMVSAHVGYIDEEFVLNPTKSQLEGESDLDMMASFVGEDKKFLAVEAQVNILPEATVLGAINYACDSLDTAYKLIVDFAKEVNPKNEKYEYVSKALGEDILNDVKKLADDEIQKIIRQEYDKLDLSEKTEELKEKVLTELEGKYKKADMVRALAELEKKAIQHLILDEGERPDGRATDEVRDILSSVGVLPRTHGSALFTRGITQSLTVATLGSPSLELLVQDMYGESNKRYIHYYNFPPFATGETGRLGMPKGREVGHGVLAERALEPVIPSQKDFPYMILLVSEVLSSSGSSSMAAACGSSLALMDAGVPIKDIVGGVGVGLIVNDDFSKHRLLTDLAYLEDAFGFLDFKMTGTRTGVTAIQSDIKAHGIPMNLLPDIVEQSRLGRMKVLDEMEKALKAPREKVSEYAPKMITIKIEPEQIGKVIGSGGKTIKEIQETTDSEIHIEEDGSIVIASVNEENAKKAFSIIDGMTKPLHVGEVYKGKVKDILDFGALVELFPGRVGLLHVSELADGFVKNVSDHLSINDELQVKIVGFGEHGKISLSVKALNESEPRSERPRNDRPRGGRDNNRGRRSDRRPRY